MKKKYLKTIEDIEALRNTDTVIHYGLDGKFILRFVNGVLCRFYKEKPEHLYEYGLTLNIEIQEPFIEVEDKPTPAPKCYIGKLGWFWDSDKETPLIDVLGEINKGDYPFYGKLCANYKHFRPLTPEEVEKYTGYKVVKEK